MLSGSTQSPWIISWLQYIVNTHSISRTIELVSTNIAAMFKLAQIHDICNFSLSSDEDSEERKDALRGKVTKYMSRAEELKTLLREGRPRVASGDELIPNQLLSKFVISIGLWQRF